MDTSARSGGRITKRKNGRTHLAHKFELAVDLEVRAVVTVQTMEDGDTISLPVTLDEVAQPLAAVGARRKWW